MICCVIVFVIVLIAAVSGALGWVISRAREVIGGFMARRDHFQLGYYDPNLYPSEITRNV